MDQQLIRDKYNQDEVRRKAEQDKKDAPDVKQGQDVAGEAGSVAQGNFSAEQKVRDAASKLAASPLDAQLAKQLEDACSISPTDCLPGQR